MKTTFYKSTLVLLMAAGTMTSCINDDDYDVPNMDCIESNLVATMQPQDIEASSIVAEYPDNDVIEAYVTSSDEGGNFFKSISFQTLDGSFGFSVPVDATSTFVSLEPGRKVFVKLENQYVDIANGSLRIGAIFLDEQGGSPQVGRIPATQINSVLERSCTVVDEDVLAREMTIAQALNDANLNTLIDLQGVQFTDGSTGNNYYDPNNAIGGATNHFLTDASGNTVIFRTSSFANFAGNPVAEGSGTVRGVLTKFGSDYQFMARTEQDVMLTNPRVVPLYQEDFQEAQDGTDFNIEGWVNYIQTGTRKWREEAFGGNGYAEFSSFGSNNASNVAWLVSPAINLDGTTNEMISFRVAQHHLDGDFDGNKLEIYIFTSFNGTDVLGATKVDITDLATLPTSATEWYEFIGSNIDVSSYSGNIHVAFKFTGSGTDTALDGAFQIDDLKLTGDTE